MHCNWPGNMLCYSSVFRFARMYTARPYAFRTSLLCALWGQVMLWVTELALVMGSNGLFLCLSVSICSSVVRHAEDLPEGRLRQWGGDPQMSPRHQHFCPGGSVRQLSTLESSLRAAPFITWTTRTSAQRHLPLAQRPPGQYDPVSCVWQSSSKFGHQMSVVTLLPVFDTCCWPGVVSSVMCSYRDVVPVSLKQLVFTLSEVMTRSYVTRHFRALTWRDVLSGGWRGDVESVHNSNYGVFWSKTSRSF